MGQKVAERLAKFGHELSFENLPQEVIQKAKLLILDTVGVCVSSAAMDFGKAAFRPFDSWGGTAESTLIGTNKKVPAHHAAFYNGVLGHGQDYDDTHTESVVHPSCVQVPAVLAAAERDGRSGRELIVALVAGTETAIRLGIVAPGRFLQRGFHTTSVCSTFGSALAVAKLRGLELDLVRNAIGIAGSFASGLGEYMNAGAGVKRLHAGWAAQCGIVAAEMAACDFPGPESVFEGRFGFYNSLLRGEKLDMGLIFDGIGDRWNILDVRPKLYPSCHCLHSFQDCAAALRQDGLEPESIERIECQVSQGAVDIVCEPWEIKLHPDTAHAARFSLPFAVAQMLVVGQAGPAEYTETAFEGSFSNPAIRRLMEKTSYTVDPKYDLKDMPGRVEVTLADGTRQAFEVPEVRGSSRSPFSQDDILAKYFVNTEAFPRKATERLAESILALDRMETVSGLLQTLTQEQW